MEASSATDIGTDTISSTCRGKQKTSGGFLWSFTDTVTPYVLHNPFEKSICLYKADGELIKQYSSIKEACEDIGMSRGAIQKRLRTGSKAKGFYLKYNEE